MNLREVFHLWAAQRRPRAKSGNVRFEGPVMFSYAEPIGFLLGDNRVMLSERRFSNTTSGHQSKASYAVHHMARVYAPVLPRHEGQNLDFVHMENDREWMSNVEVLRKEYLANKRLRSRLSDIESNLAARDAYSAFFGLGWTRPSMGELDKQLEVEALRMKLLAEERRRIAVAEAEARAKEQAEALVDWRNNVERRYPHFEVTALRLSIDKAFIETSRGARVPVEVAPWLWRAATRCKAQGIEYTPAHSERQVGDYRLTMIHPDGTLVVGCHTIPFTELELIAEQLGWLHKEAA